ncbi:transcriptional regulator [Skermanella stibiiresistens SB22]|uniref:HTH-type transcriptional regulator BetI n=1 Tax=Skermanella stibiiresistens SB22 TaxID=1385369 RepID=W9H8T2_9PROT|nr:transcriptional regulator BetI [Skermanella stibiiresistens]EWY42660.1 transcriptional regulator [Skermanella stibiiresistens SB22]
MPKVGMEPIRRQQLIEATITSISRYGFADATISRISKEAGVSTGIIHHYFGSKDDLLEATMRTLLQQLRRDVVERLSAASTPEQRLAAIIDGNFADAQFDRPVIVAWLAFWAQVPHVPELARLQRVNARRLRSNLLYDLRRLLPNGRAEEAATGLAALIDGLWLRASLDGAENPATARTIVRGYLAAQLGTAAETVA